MKTFFSANTKWVLVCLVLLCCQCQVKSLRDIRDLAPKNQSCDIRVMQTKYVKFEAVPSAVCGTAIALAILLAIAGRFGSSICKDIFIAT